MFKEYLDIKNSNSMDYAEAYFCGHDYSEGLPHALRPVIVVVPGGGYEYTSVREAEPIATQFLAMGSHTVVLKYSCAPAVFPTALGELAAIFRILREKADEWHIDVDHIIPIGFSAGAHLVGCLSAFWKEDWLSQLAGCQGGSGAEAIRPDAQILCYPVITSGTYAHDGSFKALLGDKYGSDKEKLSLEKIVNEDIPETFVWHTFEDGSVPVQNSLLYVSALAEAGIPVEYHLFESGSHGAALGNHLTANEDKQLVPGVCPWVNLARHWLESEVHIWK